MTTGLTEVDPAVLRLVLLRLTELDAEVHGVTDVVLDHLPYVDAGAAEATVTELGAGLVDAFATLSESLAETERRLRSADERPLEIDLRSVEPLDRAVR